MTNRFLIIIVILLLFSGCTKLSNNTPTTNKDNQIMELENKIDQLTSLNDQYKEQINQLTENTSKQGGYPLSISYISYPEKYRFVGNATYSYWMPDANGPITQSILPGTLVEVVLSGYKSENDIWLFVRIPVYDTPTNCFGWIEESNTEMYTQENQKLVMNPIIISKGTIGESDTGAESVKDYDRMGMIEKKENGRVLIMFAGGNEVWYNENDIKYPPLTD